MFHLGIMEINVKHVFIFNWFDVWVEKIPTHMQRCTDKHTPSLL